MNNLFSNLRLRGERSVYGKKDKAAAPQSPLSAQILSRCSTKEARDCVAYEQSLKIQALPLGLTEVNGRSVLSVAGAQSRQRDIEQALRFICERQIRFFAVDQGIIDEAIYFAYHRDEQKLKVQVAELKQVIPRADEPGVAPAVLDVRTASTDIGKFFASLVDYAIASEASDVHICPRIEGSFVSLRVHGELRAHEQSICSLVLHRQLIGRIKALANLDTTEQRLPQDGSFSFAVARGRCLCRVSLMPTVHGEKAVIRFMLNQKIPPIEQLGFDREALELLTDSVGYDDGVVLFSGPTGSGKSTSMYSVMKYLGERGLNLVSVEDPVEIEVDGVSQTSLDAASGLTYESCLKSILRQDPDAILVGEMRDQASAQISFQAALTGHLIVSTVHARNVFEVFLRLQALKVDELSVAQSLRLVVSQRLARTLCPFCKVIDLAATNLRKIQINRAVGCKDCDYSGFSGRVLVSEVLRVAPPLRQEIAAHGLGSALNFKKIPIGDYVPFHKALERLIVEGSICYDDIKRIEDGQTSPTT